MGGITVSVKVAGSTAAAPGGGTPDPSLARTGVEVGLLLLLAAAALAVGWALWAAARRGRLTDPQAEI